MQHEITECWVVFWFRFMLCFLPMNWVQRAAAHASLIYQGRMAGMFWRVCFLQRCVGYWRGGCLLVWRDPTGHLSCPVHQNPVSFSCVQKLNFTPASEQTLFFPVAMTDQHCSDSLCCRSYFRSVNLPLGIILVDYLVVPVVLTLGSSSCHHNLDACFKSGKSSVRW